MQDPSKPSIGMMQVIRNIAAEDGLAGFFKGWWAQIIALGASNFIYFYASNMIKVIVMSRYAASRRRQAARLADGLN